MSNYIDEEYMNLWGRLIEKTEPHIQQDLKKSLIGIKPRKFFIEERIKELSEVINTYADRGEYPDIMDEWCKELIDRVHEFKNL